MDNCIKATFANPHSVAYWLDFEFWQKDRRFSKRLVSVVSGGYWLWLGRFWPVSGIYRRINPRPQNGDEARLRLYHVNISQTLFSRGAAAILEVSTRAHTTPHYITTPCRRNFKVCLPAGASQGGGGALMAISVFLCPELCVQRVLCSAQGGDRYLCGHQRRYVDILGGLLQQGTLDNDHCMQHHCSHTCPGYWLPWHVSRDTRDCHDNVSQTRHWDTPHQIIDPAQPSPAQPSPAVDGNDTNNIEAHACRRLIFILETSMKECEVILTFPTFEQWTTVLLSYNVFRRTASGC